MLDPAHGVPDRTARADGWSVHRATTRRAILDAFIAIIDEENPATVSMPGVAERAGVAVRTLYRYFPNKDALMLGANEYLNAEARARIGAEAIDMSNLEQYVREQWTSFAANLPAARARLVGGASRDLRIERAELLRAAVRSQMPDGVPIGRQDELVDTIVALVSTSMFLELVDRPGHTPDDAARIAVRLVELAISDAKEHP